MLSNLVKGSMDASDFEDGCRARLGTSAFELFTLEWLVEQMLALARALSGEDARLADGTP
ncbi:hypothetical protein T484DRAFT_1864585 [Baffinella frigidus]|nr:hypothetical protein T484DRAFT_1864585 [Cryptophyta sp. CCMP2293]